MNTPYITEIIKNKKETEDVKTLTFRYPKSVTPGQFFMVWVPGVDEIPMSVSYIKNDIKGITFRKIGDATASLYNSKKGGKIGIRGPYGNGFKIDGNNILFVGGGTGIAMLAPAVEQALHKRISSTVIIGVKKSNELFFEERLKNCGANIYISTDDGSKGYKGFASDLAKKLSKEHKFTSVLTCGPELMMKSLLDFYKDISFQASIERYIKCSIGLCGQCCLGKGLRVCKEGPVFDGNTLKNIDDFGIFKRDSAGRKIKF